MDFSFSFLLGTKTRIRLLLSRANDRESKGIENEFCVGRLTEVILLLKRELAIVYQER